MMRLATCAITVEVPSAFSLWNKYSAVNSLLKSAGRLIRRHSWVSTCETRSHIDKVGDLLFFPPCSFWTDIIKEVPARIVGPPFRVLSVCALDLSDHHCVLDIMIHLLVIYFLFATSWTNTKRVNQTYINFNKVCMWFNHSGRTALCSNWIVLPLLRSYQKNSSNSDALCSILLHVELFKVGVVK